MSVVWAMKIKQLRLAMGAPTNLSRFQGRAHPQLDYAIPIREKFFPTLLSVRCLHEKLLSRQI